MGDARMLAERGDKAVLGDQSLKRVAVFAVRVSEKFRRTPEFIRKSPGRLGYIGGIDRPIAVRHVGVRSTMVADGNPVVGEFADLIPAHDAMGPGIDRIRRYEQGEGQARRLEPGPSLLIDRAIGVVDGYADGPERQAEAYARGGASALSVVVEPDFFGGSYELLERCRCASGLPSLAKDFVVDELQLHWAHEAGASAVLLIAALYDAEELAAYAGLARQLGLVPLVETHSADDVEKLAGAEWELIGVNNRDLRTFEVDLQHSMDLVASLPPAIKVAESGLESAVDIRALHRAGFDAFLIGESLLLAEDPAAKLAELLES